MWKLYPFEDGVRLEIKVQPSSSKDEVAGVVEGKLKIRLKAKPVKNEANKSCVKFLSKLFDIAKTDIIIEKGLRSKNKLILLKGVSIDIIKTKIDSLLSDN